MLIKNNLLIYQTNNMYTVYFVSQFFHLNVNNRGRQPFMQDPPF